MTAKSGGYVLRSVAILWLSGLSSAHNTVDRPHGFVRTERIACTYKIYWDVKNSESFVTKPRNFYCLNIFCYSVTMMKLRSLSSFSM